MRVSEYEGSRVDVDLDSLRPLPLGITEGSLPDGSVVDLARFKAACFYVARKVGGRVLRIELRSNIPTSYAYARLELDDRETTVLCNKAYPVIAFTDKPRPYMSHEFTEEPEVAALFASVSFHPVPLETLKAHPDAWLASMDAGEQKYFRYEMRSWGIRQIGDFVFNDWD